MLERRKTPCSGKRSHFKRPFPFPRVLLHKIRSKINRNFIQSGCPFRHVYMSCVLRAIYYRITLTALAGHLCFCLCVLHYLCHSNLIGKIAALCYSVGQQYLVQTPWTMCRMQCNQHVFVTCYCNVYVLCLTGWLMDVSFLLFNTPNKCWIKLVCIIKYIFLNQDKMSTHYTRSDRVWWGGRWEE